MLFLLISLPAKKLIFILIRYFKSNLLIDYSKVSDKKRARNPSIASLWEQSSIWLWWGNSWYTNNVIQYTKICTQAEMRENGCEKSAELSGAGAARWGGRGRLDGRTPGGWRQSRQPLQNLHFGDVLTRKLQKYLAIVFYTSYSRNLHKLNLWTNIKKQLKFHFFAANK